MKFKKGDIVRVKAYTYIKEGNCCKQFLPLGTTGIIEYVTTGLHTNQQAYILDKGQRFAYLENELEYVGTTNVKGK